MTPPQTQEMTVAFTNEKGQSVGGAVAFADWNPRLELNLVLAAKEQGFILEPSDHDHNVVSKEWSELNHAFSGARSASSAP